MCGSKISPSGKREALRMANWNTDIWLQGSHWHSAQLYSKEMTRSRKNYANRRQRAMRKTLKICHEPGTLLSVFIFTPCTNLFTFIGHCPGFCNWGNWNSKLNNLNQKTILTYGFRFEPKSVQECFGFIFLMTFLEKGHMLVTCLYSVMSLRWWHRLVLVFLTFTRIANNYSWTRQNEKILDVYTHNCEY